MAHGRNTRSNRSSSRSGGWGRSGGRGRSTGRAMRGSGRGKRSLVGRGVKQQTVKLQLQIVGAPATAASPFLGRELKEVPKGRAKF